MQDYDQAQLDIAKYSDVDPGTIDALRYQYWVARDRVETAMVQARTQVQGQLATLRSQLEQAEQDQVMKELQLQLLHEEADRQAATDAAAQAAAADSGVGSSISRFVRMPLRVLVELIVGVGQSPQEIVDILRNGQDNIGILRAQTDAVDRAADAEHLEAERLRRQLEECVGANGSASATPMAGAGAATP